MTTASRSCLIPEQPQRTPAEAAELSLVRMGRAAILASLLLVFADATLFSFPLFSLLVVVLYVGYVVVYWGAIHTRRAEAVVLCVIALCLAVLYIGAEIPLWTVGPGLEAEAIIGTGGAGSS